jgi:hypothetical protein
MDAPAARDALGYAHALMVERSRAESTADFYPLFVIIDEFDVFAMSDPAFAKMLFMLAKMGREVEIYLLIATQSPKQEMFGNTGTRAQFGVSVALRVKNRHESEAILGATEPRADHLSGSGDAQVVTDELTVRTLIALTTPEEAAQLGGGEPELRRYPPADTNALNGDDAPGPAAQAFTPAEAMVALRAVLADWGRPAVNKALQEHLGYGMGSDRIDKRLLPLGAELAELWQKMGGCLPA